MCEGLLAALVALAMVAAFGCSAPQDCPPPPPPPECPPCTCPDCATPTPPPAPGCSGAVTEEWMHLNVRILFPTGGSVLDEEAQRLLQEAVMTLRGRTDIRRIRVEGHTDSRGPDASNSQLALQRAQAVVQYLVGLGVPESMLEAQGYGSERPVTSDATAMDREQNRRVEFSILVCRPAGSM